MSISHLNRPEKKRINLSRLSGSMRTILLLLICLVAAPLYAQVNGKAVLGHISTWGGLGLTTSGIVYLLNPQTTVINDGEVVMSDRGGAMNNRDIFLIIGAGSFIGTGLYSFFVGGLPLFLGDTDVFAIANTIAGATAVGVALLGPFLPYALVPIAFLVDTLFIYGPLHGYQKSLVKSIVDSLNNTFTNFDQNIAQGWYGSASMWAATLPPIVWLLGTGIIGLSLDDVQTVSTAPDKPALTPVLSPSYIGLSIQY